MKIARSSAEKLVSWLFPLGHLNMRVHVRGCEQGRDGSLDDFNGFGHPPHRSIHAMGAHSPADGRTEGTHDSQIGEECRRNIPTE